MARRLHERPTSRGPDGPTTEEPVTMSKKLAALFPLAALMMAATDAGAVALDTGGGRTGAPPPPKVAPKTACGEMIRLYAADADPAGSRMNRYRFAGVCHINVAPAGRQPRMAVVNVLIDAEWFPKMNRASERVVIDHPDLATTFTTWATCTRDPFLFDYAGCADQGIGANKYSMFLRTGDVPFARGRAPKADAIRYTEKAGADAKQLFAPVKIDRIRQPAMQEAGTLGSIMVEVSGGVRLCPMEMDFGDGHRQRLRVESENKSFHLFNHTYDKPGVYTIKARALPGCTGEASVVVIVKPAKAS